MYNLDVLLHQLRELTDGFVQSATEIKQQQVEHFIELRERICHEIMLANEKDGPLNERQKEELKAILSYDEIIKEYMGQLKLEAMNWLERNQKIKAQKQAYDLAGDYDSLFIDWKK